MNRRKGSPGKPAALTALTRDPSQQSAWLFDPPLLVNDELHFHLLSREEFDAWYADLQRRRREADEAKYRRYAERLREQAEACGRLVDMTERCSEDFSDLEREHAGVGKHVEGLSAHCERLATERDRLEGYAGALRERLSYFDGLEQAASELRRASPSDAKGFTRLMARIEECAEYVGRNPQYVDAGEYAARFKQLRAKALGSVKSFASASLRKASQAAKHEGSRSVERQRAAFRAELPDLAPVAKEIANRRSRQPEYAQLARDLAEAFCDNRASSLESIAREHAEELARDGLERLAREGPSFFASLVEREREVLAAFLGSTELSHDAPLNRLAEPLGNALYDAFRPRLVATDSVDRLCAVAEAVVSGPLGGDLAAHPQESSQLAEPLARKLLGDARERLAFRAQALVRSAFAKHKPDPSSLSLPSPEKPGVGSFSPVDQAMDLLPRLASVLEAWVFAGLAQEAILRVSEACHAATKALESSGKPRADAELFSIAQLLRLRSALSHLEATPSPGPSQAPSLDFSHLRQELSRLLPLGSKSRRLHDEDGEGGTGTPSNPAAASSSGLLQELDSRLQVACESYIMSTTQLLLEPLLTFTSKASASRDQGASLRSRAFGHPDRVAEAVSRARSSLQSHLPAVRFCFPSFEVESICLLRKCE